MKLLKIIKLSLCLGITLILGACGGGSVGSSGSGGSSGSATLYSLGGTITGLNAGNAVTFQVVLSNGNNSSDSTTTATVTSIGKFTTPPVVPANGSYVVIVTTQPSGQICTVTNGSGSNVTANVTNINVVCSSTTYTVSGTVSGLLAGQEVTLLNNNADPLQVSANGGFTFVTPVAQGGGYSVTVKSASLMSTCNVANGTGLDVNANVATAVVTCAVTESLLYSFTGFPDAYRPQVSLVQGADGNFYGTTGNGGSGGTNSLGLGSVFQVTPLGVERVFYSFNGVVTADGACPQAPMILASDGNFYGTTCSGGQFSNNGTVFKISPGGVESVLHSFGSGSDGANPYAALVQGTDGNFYGTTAIGGAHGKGSVFMVTSSGVETVLYSFGTNGSADGINPHAALVQGPDGNFYGTTLNGGTNNHGTVFMITPTGIESVLWSFGSTVNDGQMGTVTNEQVAAALVVGADGNFYGTTPSGGLAGNGTVFKVTAAGAETVLHSFASGTTDGQEPLASLLLAGDGNFYGTTISGGKNNAGTVYKINAAGVETMMYSFGAIGDGQQPYAQLIQGNDKHLYGTTYLGGASYGTVFKF